MKFKKISMLLVGMLTVGTIFGCGKEDTADSETTTEVSTEASTEEDASSDISAYVTDEDIDMDTLVASVKLCDYSNITITTTKQEVTDEDVEDEMNSYLSYFSTYEQVTEGTVADGDTANITFVGTIDGEEFDGGSGTYDLEIGSGAFIDGFESGLIGATIGDTVELNLTFPEDYSSEDLAGKDVVFTVTINYVQGDAVEPTLTDEYLAANTDYESVEELREAVTSYFEYTYENTYETNRENELLDYLMDNSEIPLIPMSYINEYVDSMTTYYDSYASLYGVELEEFLTSYVGVTLDEFNSQAQTSALNYMQSTVLLQAIANEQGITLSDDEFTQYVTDFAEDNGYDSADDLLEALEENDETDEMREEALYSKIMDYLFEDCTTQAE